ncbi:Protein OS-9 [Linnemannia zychae]|nr:Protein OS-9 [Linnemannia zychae]
MRIKMMSPTQAAILACATIGTISLFPATHAFSVNFVYNDLLAHPQYDVQFLKEVIPASSVPSRPNRHRRQSMQRQAQIETTKTEGQDREQETIHESPSTVVMTDMEGMRWSCMIPPKLVHEVKATPKLTPQEAKEEERRSIQRGLELLDHLSGTCLTMSRDYWTYEYCHKKSIRQYHAVPKNNQWVPESEDSTYVLALYQSGTTNAQGQPANNEAALQQRSSSSSVGSAITTTELEVSNDRKYLVQQWEHGDLCDLTQLPRKVEVQFQCAPFGDRIQAVTEPSTCNYIMVISSLTLCKDTAFESVPSPEANKIQCRRIVSDEQYQTLKAANVHREAIDGSDLGAGIVQDDNAQIKIGQVPRQQSTHKQKQQPVGAAKPQAVVLSDFEKVLKQAKLTNDKDSQKLEEVIAQYAAFSDVIMAMMTPELRAMYQKILDLLQTEDGDDKQTLWSDKDEKMLQTILDALTGGADETKEQSNPKQQLKIQDGMIDMTKLFALLDATGSAGTTGDATEEQGQEHEQNQKTSKKKNEAHPKL